MAVPSQIETSVHIERHYAVTEIAEMWNLSPDKVRELFEREVGVLVIGESNPRRKRSSNAFTLGCHRNQYRGRRSTSCSQPIEDISKVADGVMKAEVIATAGAPFGLTEYWAARRYVNH